MGALPRAKTATLSVHSELMGTATSAEGAALLQRGIYGKGTEVTRRGLSPPPRPSLIRRTLIDQTGQNPSHTDTGLKLRQQRLCPLCLAGERFRCHPVGTAVLILLLLVLVLALGAALAVPAAPQLPVTPATPLLVLGCPHGWIGYNGVCYYFSRDYSTWEQGQERCSELNASLAIAQDEEAMDLLFRLRGNGDFWLGLRRRGERLHWGDGSSYSSR
ncbi:C-type lectin domain family 2 member D6-like [Ammospiza maritima maritima]